MRTCRYSDDGIFSACALRPVVVSENLCTYISLLESSLSPAAEILRSCWLCTCQHVGCLVVVACTQVWDDLTCRFKQNAQPAVPLITLVDCPHCRDLHRCCSRSRKACISSGPSSETACWPARCQRWTSTAPAASRWLINIHELKAVSTCKGGELEC